MQYIRIMPLIVLLLFGANSIYGMLPNVSTATRSLSATSIRALPRNLYAYANEFRAPRKQFLMPAQTRQPYIPNMQKGSAPPQPNATPAEGILTRFSLWMLNKILGL